MNGLLRKVDRAATLGLLLVVASGCSTLPRSVSSLSEVQDASTAGDVRLVPLTAATLPQPGRALEAGFPPELTQSQEFDFSRLGIGDRLQVRIWEGGTPSLFTTAGGADLGELTIDETGRIFLPYAGAVQAAGLTVSQLRAAITARLSRVVLRPQVDIRPAERRSALVSVQGDAAKPGVYPIDQGRTRLSSMLAEVAPNQKNAEMLQVTVRRDNASGQVRLSDIYRDPALNIALQPGDQVILSNVVESVTVLGAAGVQGQVPIARRDFSLMDVIGQARGLSEDAADPRAVFLMRQPENGSGVPTVYQVDMRKPGNIDLANRLVVQDGDAVLISTAPFAQTRKVLSAFSQSLGAVRAATTTIP
ncbi:polysaccharide biosynthesis/export family protein [Sphingomonas arenae]|uniref:polysaccharide biosynthesis/export family protein n=1 Tax=Sphingomonas arenae TaxID=2812555 RepID=UPI0019679ADF|nr:polysaccharide biosynthesis/export family protein [Sphingomonas arenae]